jgi:hypothetical protein
MRTHHAMLPPGPRAKTPRFNPGNKIEYENNELIIEGIENTEYPTKYHTNIGPVVIKDVDDNATLVPKFKKGDRIELPRSSNKFYIIHDVERPNTYHLNDDDGMFVGSAFIEHVDANAILNPGSNKYQNSKILGPEHYYGGKRRTRRNKLRKKRRKTKRRKTNHRR